METLDLLKGVLGQFFRDEFYVEGVKNLRKSLRNEPTYSSSWTAITSIILSKELDDGQALYLLDNSANYPLYENSDEEAYKWLNLMLINAAGAEDDPILDYEDVFRPKKDEEE